MVPRLHQLGAQNPNQEPGQPRRGGDVFVEGEGIAVPERVAEHEVRDERDVEQGGDVDGVQAPEVAAPRVGCQ